MSGGSKTPKRFLKGCLAKEIIDLDSAFFVADRRLEALFESRKQLETRMCVVEKRVFKLEERLKKARQKQKKKKKDKKETKTTTKKVKKERK